MRPLLLASAVVSLLVLQGLAPGDALAQDRAGRPNEPGAARAEAEGARAAALRAEGEDLAAQGNCRDAVTRLRAAYALRKEAPTVILLGECEVRLGRLPDAAGHLAEGLSMLGEGKERARVQALFDEVRPKVGGIQLTVNVTGATVIAGSFVGQTPVQEVFVKPGEVSLLVKKTGYGEQQRKVTTEAGQTVRVEIKLSATGNVAGGGREGRAMSLLPAYVAGGLAVIGIGVGVGLRLSGEAKGSDADDALAQLQKVHGAAPCQGTSPPEDCAAIKGLRQDHDRLVNASTGVLIGGGALLGGAVLYGALANRHNRRSFAVVPVGSQTGGGLLIQGSF